MAAAAAVLLISACQGSPVATSSPAQPPVAGSAGQPKPAADGTGAPATLDEPSARWFNTLCTGLQPLDDYLQGGTLSGGNAPDDAAEQTGQGFSDGGAELQQLATTLKSLPLPTFPGGGEFALGTTADLDQIGGILLRAGQRMTAGDEAWADELDADVLINGGPLRDLSTAAPSAEITEQILAIPSCAEIEA